MIVAFSASHKDWFECKRLLDWCRELGTYPKHTALVVFGKQVTEQQQLEVIAAAKSCNFSAVHAIKQKEEDSRGWPWACNQMFAGAMKWIEDVGRAPFLWMESDVTPLKSGWLDSLEQEYLVVAKPFMGFVFDWVSATRYLPHLTGIAVYPPNFRRLNPYPLAATNVPWDVTRPDLTLPRTHKTNLIFHDWGDRVTNVAPTFPDQESLSRIPTTAVLMHRCKDGTLIDRLRERIPNGEPKALEPYPTLPVARKIMGLLMSPFIGRPKRKLLRVRRLGAYGDVIAATCVAEKLTVMGYDVVFQTVPVIQPILELCPAIKAIEDPCDPCDVVLDGAYEAHPYRTTKAFWEIYIEQANLQLGNHGIFIDNSVQCTPRLNWPNKRSARWADLYRDLPKPWIAICPRSNSFVNRTVPNEIWGSAAKAMDGTVFWLGTDKGPEHIFHPWPRSMVDVGDILKTMDLLVSVDSGPLHLAAAIGTPCIALLQASSPALHLTDSRDWDMLVPASLDCLNCQKNLCPIDEKNPPCQNFDPHAIAAAVNRKLEQYTSENVTAIVTAYKPPADRLNRCLAAVLPQVAQVIVTLNADGVIPPGVMAHPKIRYVKTRLASIGYGRNANFGARHSNTKYLLFLNDDVFLDPGAVETLMEVMKQDPKCGMVGHLLFYPDRKKIQHGGTQRNAGDLGWGHIDHNKSKPSITSVTEMENVTQASALMRRKAFYEAGCYDERYFCYFEDNALSLQFRRTGWKIFYTPFATGIHDEHATTTTYATQFMAEQVKKSRRVFQESWGKYFTHNKPPGIGNFNYE